MGNNTSSTFEPRDEQTKAILAAVRADDIATFNRLCRDVKITDLPDWTSLVKECRSAGMLDAMVKAEKNDHNTVVLHATDEILRQYSRVYHNGSLLFLYIGSTTSSASPFDRLRVYERLGGKSFEQANKVAEDETVFTALKDVVRAGDTARFLEDYGESTLRRTPKWRRAAKECRDVEMLRVLHDTEMKYFGTNETVVSHAEEKLLAEYAQRYHNGDCSFLFAGAGHFGAQFGVYQRMGGDLNVPIAALNGRSAINHLLHLSLNGQRYETILIDCLLDGSAQLDEGFRRDVNKLDSFFASTVQQAVLINDRFRKLERRLEEISAK